MEQNGSHSAYSLNGKRIVPLYFFHLSFGDRILPDDEGVELPNRSAAREEALAAVRDLSDPAVGGNPRRWASWFLQVADEQGGFFRTPIGHPALEIVAPDVEKSRVQSASCRYRWPRGLFFRRTAAPEARMADIIQQRKARQQCTAQLLRDNKQLRSELSSIYHTCENIGVRTSRLVLLARAAGSRY
jgi:hypothetical protein